MTSPLAETAQPTVRVRFAKPADARAISQLYVSAYTPAGGGSAREHYPFPQIMEEDKVIDLITGGTVVWVVAERPDREIAGSAAAVRNIGSQKDRIAEIFGVAVEQAFQRRGVGSALLRRRHTELTRMADFILCEARTAEAGGWKSARNAGFQPVGFEPYAHAMRVGFESMVPTASWNWANWAPSARTHALSAVENTRVSFELAQTVYPRFPVSPSLPTTRDRRLIRKEIAPDEALPDIVDVRRDDELGQTWFAGSSEVFGRQSSVVEFCPFYGVEPHLRRFEHAFYVASTGASDVAAARVFYDRTDARARILGLRTVVNGIEPQFLEGIVDKLLQLSGDGPVVIVLCVRAGAPATQIALEAMEFFPTAYFPGMISAPMGRADVLQYTRLIRRSWSESARSVTALEWPEARRLIDQVLQDHVGPT